MSENWHGIFPALPTQFHEDFSIDFDGTMQHVTTLLDAGVHGIVMMGTIGENCSLSAEEKRELLRKTVETAAGRAPVLTGVAECATATACRYAADAAEIGADGLMVLPAMVYKADSREAVAHFKAVAGASELPILCYNNPAAYGVDMTPETFVELRDVETIVAIKEASEDIRRITDLFNAHGDRFTLFAGVDDVALEGIMLGCTGFVSGVADAFPKENVRMWDLAMKGDWEGAREIYRWMMPLSHMDTHSKLVQYMKLMCQECGIGHERTRPPRLAIEGTEREWALGLIHKAIETRPQL